MGNELRELYMKESKHSNYQILPSILKELLKEDELKIQSRYEQERFCYISQNLDIKNKVILDIGGNTGFFTFEAYSSGAKMVNYYEGNIEHAQFVQKAVEILKLKNKIDVWPEYYIFGQDQTKCDVVFLLNVVHHLGDDFDKEENNIWDVKERMLLCINSLAEKARVMVFQMGFNWKGDRNNCLFRNGTKEEMEKFLLEGTSKYWNIKKIGIAIRNNGGIKYVDMDMKNNVRDDSLGEFLNRPIFIMESKKVK